VDGFRFCCTRCAHEWTVDYDVAHVDDGHGVALDCYSLGGRPITAPTARGVVHCPLCGASPVHVELVAARDTVTIRPQV
jgi:hypothetical protein